MFGSSGLSLPAPFAHEHRPLRLASEAARAQPTGQCHYQLSNTALNETCACQVYQHNRSAPGNVCDCGHSACYHGQSSARKPEARTPNITENVTEIVKKLEDMIRAEREAREVFMVRERHRWETEIRILREALAPFYRTEEALQRRLIQVEGKLNLTADEQARLKQRLSSLDQVSTRDRQESPQAVKPSPLQLQSPASKATSNPDDLPGSSNSSDDRSSASSFSRQPTPNECESVAPEPESPRSSGVLDLVRFPRPTVPASGFPTRLHQSAASVEEPRSSGFLGVDLKEHLKSRAARSNRPAPPPSYSTVNGIHKSSSRVGSPSASAGYRSPRSLPRPSPPVSSRHPHLERPSSQVEAPSPQHRSSAGSETMALDVLADVSAASPSLA